MPPKGWKKQTTKAQDIDALCADTPLPQKSSDLKLKDGKNEELDRRAEGLSPQQERFVYEYVKDYDRIEALRRAGYNVQNLNTAQVQASRILRTPAAMELIDDIQCAILATNMIDANWAIVRFKLTYMKALNDRDYSNALRALENISKFLGLYERHNRQKRYTADDIDELRGELEQAGFNFEITATEKIMIAARGNPVEGTSPAPTPSRVVEIPANTSMTLNKYKDNGASSGEDTR